MTITMHFNAEKKHSVRYDGDVDAALSSIYIMKKDLPKPIPRVVVVTLEFPNV